MKMDNASGTEERQSSAESAGDREALEHLRRELASGRHWYPALLEAIGLWSSPEDTHNGCRRRYLIGGEAFDWLLLAERLCQEVDDLIPRDEQEALLLYGRPPLELGEEEFRGLVGQAKYQAYLNYLYGVIVEEALLLAVEQEIEKERHAYIFSRSSPDFEDGYQRVYGADRPTLLRRFRKETGHPERAGSTLAELKEFTYWLFKYRLKNCDKARVASDTRKGLDYLERQRHSEGLLRAAGGSAAGRPWVFWASAERERNG